MFYAEAAIELYFLVLELGLDSEIEELKGVIEDLFEFRPSISHFPPHHDAPGTIVFSAS